MSLKPYYQDDACTIYHGDCRDLLDSSQLESVDLVLTDPPYVGLKGGMATALPGVGKRREAYVGIGDEWEADLDWMAPAWALAELAMVVFCSYANVPDVAAKLPAEVRVGLLTWHKRNSPVRIANTPRYTTEFVWLFKKKPGLRWRNLKTTMFDIPALQGGCMATERLLDADGRSVHPTQKPLELVHRILAIGGRTVLDPFMGSGTTLLAAKNLGRKAIGVEISEKYCEIAAKRLAQEVLPLEVS